MCPHLPGLEHLLIIKADLTCAVTKKIVEVRPICTLYNLSANVNISKDINMFDAHTLPSESKDVTMVTQLDTSRIPRLIAMAQAWKCKYVTRLQIHSIYVSGQRVGI